ncbi:hypothetical protein QZH41_005105 [Actinostola sp. cb2023]|nr:hypothetical protein QZH41_005105 [Actinostola sp. cb2023]
MLTRALPVLVPALELDLGPLLVLEKLWLLLLRWSSAGSARKNSYQEFSLASMLYFAMKEGACSEQSSRMTAMGAASKNAGKSITSKALHDQAPQYYYFFAKLRRQELKFVRSLNFSTKFC